MPTADSESSDRATEYEPTPEGWQRRYKAEIDAALDEHKSWLADAEWCNRLYAGKSTTAPNEYHSSAAKFRLFSAYVNTMIPALYAQTPVVQVSRTFQDSDPIGRAAAEILERCSRHLTLGDKFDAVMIRVAKDLLIAGRSTSWTSYEADVLVEESVPEENITSESITDERICFDSVIFSDYTSSAARTEDEVNIRAKRVYLSRKQLIEKFGGEIGARVPLMHSPKAKDRFAEAKIADSVWRKAEVWEIWDKEEKKVIWLCRDFPEVLSVENPPFDLRGFFPCPPPLTDNTPLDSIIPVPDGIIVRDQLRLLNELAAKNAEFVEDLKIAAIYAGHFPEIARLATARNGTFIGVQNWPEFAATGKLAGILEYWPIENIVRALEVVGQQFAAQKSYFDELTGFADILRGYADPQETATAVTKKGKYANLRLSQRQRAVQNYARSLLEKGCEIIAEKFSPETVYRMAGGESLPEDIRANFLPALALLRDDKLRTFRLNIETDSTIAVDQETEKSQRLEFLDATGKFIKDALPMAQSVPPLAPYALESILFAARSFKAARPLETVLEQSIEQVKAAQARAQATPPQQQLDPLVMAEQVKLQGVQAKLQQDAQIEQAKMQASYEGARADRAIEIRRIDQDYQLKLLRLQEENAIAREKLDHEKQLAVVQAENDFVLKRMELEAKLATQAIPENTLNLATDPSTGLQIIEASENTGA